MVDFKLNGEDVSVDVPAGTTLLSMLANNLGVAGAKYGCGKSQCGACAVLIDGELVIACQTSAESAAGRSVTTLSGLMEDGKPSALQQAFIDEQAAQCGYCTAGMIITAQALLDRNPSPSRIGRARRAQRKPVPLRHPQPNRAGGAARGRGGLSDEQAIHQQAPRGRPPRPTENRRLPVAVLRTAEAGLRGRGRGQAAARP